MVDIARFVEAIGKLAWRHGVVAGPGVKHEVQASGDHVITIVVPKLLATWTDPVKGSQTAHYPSAGWTPRKELAVADSDAHGLADLPDGHAGQAMVWMVLSAPKVRGPSPRRMLVAAQVAWTVDAAA